MKGANNFGEHYIKKKYNIQPTQVTVFNLKGTVYFAPQKLRMPWRGNRPAIKGKISKSHLLHCVLEQPLSSGLGLFLKQI